MSKRFIKDIFLKLNNVMARHMVKNILRLGVVWSLTSHFPTFACFLNTLTNDCKKFLSKYTRTPKQFKDAKIEYVWSEDREGVEKIAKAHKITIVDNINEMIEKIDGALVLTRYPYKNLEYAKPFIEAGIPTFIDKPFAPNVKTAYEIVKLSRKHRTPIMSTSALRYAIELEPLKSFIKEKDEVWGGTIIAPGDFRVENTLYGIHVIEFLSALFGRGIERVWGTEFKVGEKLHVFVNIIYKDGKAFNLHLGSPYYKWQITLVSKGASTSTTIENAYEYYRRTINNILEMIKKRIEPINLLDTLEVVRTCFAIQKSIEEEVEVILDKDFPLPRDLEL